MLRKDTDHFVLFISLETVVYNHAILTLAILYFKWPHIFKIFLLCSGNSCIFYYFKSVILNRI